MVSLPVVLMLVFAALIVGWFGRVFMEKHRADALAKIDAESARIGVSANAYAKQAQDKLNEFRNKP